MCAVLKGRGWSHRLADEGNRHVVDGALLRLAKFWKYAAVCEERGPRGERQMDDEHDLKPLPRGTDDEHVMSMVSDPRRTTPSVKTYGWIARGKLFMRTSAGS